MLSIARPRRERAPIPGTLTINEHISDRLRHGNGAQRCAFKDDALQKASAFIAGSCGDRDGTGTCMRTEGEGVRFGGDDMAGERGAVERDGAPDAGSLVDDATPLATDGAEGGEL